MALIRAISAYLSRPTKLNCRPSHTSLSPHPSDARFNGSHQSSSPSSRPSPCLSSFLVREDFWRGRTCEVDHRRAFWHGQNPNEGGWRHRGPGGGGLRRDPEWRGGGGDLTEAWGCARGQQQLLSNKQLEHERVRKQACYWDLWRSAGQFTDVSEYLDINLTGPHQRCGEAGWNRRRGSILFLLCREKTIESVADEKI